PTGDGGGEREAQVEAEEPQDTEPARPSAEAQPQTGTRHHVHLEHLRPVSGPRLQAGGGAVPTVCPASRAEDGDRGGGQHGGGSRGPGPEEHPGYPALRSPGRAAGRRGDAPPRVAEIDTCSRVVHARTAQLKLGVRVEWLHSARRSGEG